MGDFCLKDDDNESSGLVLKEQQTPSQECNLRNESSINVNISKVCVCKIKLNNYFFSLQNYVHHK